MQVNKWDFEKHKYKKTKINDKCSKYEENLDTIIKCANCNKDIKFGESFTSLQYHDNIGFGYGVCADCYKNENYLRWKNQITFTQTINGVEHHFEVEENKMRGRKIKIIELLNRIANNQKVPTVIKYNVNLPEYQVLIYDEEEQEYRFENDYNEFWQVPNHHLNDEVEILEV